MCGERAVFEGTPERAGAVGPMRHHLVDASIGIEGRERYKCLDVVVEVGREVGEAIDAAIMGEERRAHAGCDDAVDALVGGVGVEVYRRGRRHHKWAPRSPQLAVRNAKGVAREHAVNALVYDAMVVLCVTFGVQKPEGVAAEGPRFVVCCDVKALGGDRAYVAVQLLKQIRAIHRDAACDEAAGVHQMPRSPRMHHHPRARKRIEERADTAGVVEVDVGQNDVAYVVGGHAQRAESRQHRRNPRAGATVDEIHRLGSLHSMARGQAGPDIPRVNRKHLRSDTLDGRVRFRHAVLTVGRGAQTG